MSSETPDYGYVAWKHFATMGLIGTVGLAAAIAGPAFFPSYSIVFLLVGVPVAIVGLWIGASYIVLYPKVFRARVDRDYMGDGAKAAGLKGDESLLDVGCGTGRVAIQLAKHLENGHVIGIDIYEGMSGNSPDRARLNARIEGVGDRVEFRHGNVLELEFEDNSFDFVTLGSVLHELHEEEDKAKALQEIRRVLKPGGALIAFEIFRTRRLFVSMLFFALVWKQKDYWFNMIRDAGFDMVSVKDYRSVIDMGVYVATKPVAVEKQTID